MVKQKRHPAWKMLASGCFLVAGGQGVLLNTQGLFIQPVASYHNFGIGPFTSVMAVGAIALMVSLAISPRLIPKFPLRRLLIVCSLGQCGLYILYSTFTQLWMWYANNAVIHLFVALPSFIAGPMLITNWFKKKRGMAMGIMLACGSISSAIFSIVGGQIIANFGYHMAYIVMGFCAMALMVTGSSLAVIHPKALNLRAFGEAEGAEPAGGVDQDLDAVGIPANAAIKSPSFILIFISVFILICAASFSSMITTHGVSIGFDIAIAASFMSVFMLGSLAGSFLLGFLNDKLGVRNTMIIALVLISAALGMIFLAGNIIYLFIPALILFGIGCFAGGVQPPMLASKLFGVKDYTSIFGTLQIAVSAAGIIAAPIYGFVFDAFGSYNPAIIIVAALALVSMLFTIAAFKFSDKLWQKVLGHSMPE